MALDSRATVSGPAMPFAGAGAEAPAAARRAERGIFTALKTMIVGAIFMARLGINGVFPLPVSLATTPLALGWLVANGHAKISIARFWLWLFLVIGALISYMIAIGRPGVATSIQSMLLYIGLFAMFLAPIPLERPQFLRYYRMLANISAVLCLIGAAQYAIQYVVKLPFLFSWRTIVPAGFLIEFNTLNETAWGSGIYKANGFFLMEASHLSQLGARGALIAAIILRDPRYFIPVVIGMLTAYSGTGFILLALFGIIPLFALFFSSRRLAPIGAIGLLMLPVVVGLAWVPLNLELFVSRIGEVDSPQSSAYARFVSGSLLLNAVDNKDFATLLFGVGPGLSQYYLDAIGPGSAMFASTWVKLLIEYGFIGIITFCAFVYFCVYSTTKKHWLAAAFLFHFTYLDGALLVPQQVFVLLLLGCLVQDKSAMKQRGPAKAPAYREFALRAGVRS